MIGSSPGKPGFLQKVANHTHLAADVDLGSSLRNLNNGGDRRTPSNSFEIPFGHQTYGAESPTALKNSTEFATARGSCSPILLAPAGSCSRPAPAYPARARSRRFSPLAPAGSCQPCSRHSPILLAQILPSTFARAGPLAHPARACSRIVLAPAQPGSEPAKLRDPP